MKHCRKCGAGACCRRERAWLGGAARPAQDKKIVIGVQCDRTGATQIVGTVLCPAMHDYFNLINSEGGIDG